ncbi:primosomal protein N' family DNA-binding protein [Nocardia aurantia]|uniref:primosomal protein N' family DNA-binding protein n=1 Tax=Nocardia aurantia TaxID=2585199 RepID=UPI0029E8023A|nr:hypothetical protein [Nocardia aurantia]
MLPLLEPAHLDRDFDYLVPPDMDALAQPGVRVRVRFSGRLVDGYLLERLDHTDHTGRLMPLDRVVSGERVLTPDILRLVTAVAARYAGTRADVLRLAIPPRHARTEAEDPNKPPKKRGKQALPASDGGAAGDVAAEPSGVGTDSESVAPTPDADSDSTSDRDPEPNPVSVDSGSPDMNVPVRMESAAPHDDSVSGAGPAHGVGEPVGAFDDGRHHNSADADAGPIGPAEPVYQARPDAAQIDDNDHSAAGVLDDTEPDTSVRSAKNPLGGSAHIEVGAEAAGRGDPVGRDRTPSPVERDGPGGHEYVVGHRGATGHDDSGTASSRARSGDVDAAREPVDSPGTAAGNAPHERRDTGDRPMREDAADRPENEPTDVVAVDLSRFDAWGRYRHGMSFIGALAQGKGPRAAWQALPGEDWAARLAELAAVTVAAGRSVIVMVPDQRDLDRVLAACTNLVGDKAVGLAAGLGPAARYRRWLAILRGTARIVVGTRSAVFAPARDLGLIMIWDDGDDTFAEPRAPYPHAREVAMLRIHESGAAFVAGGFARTAEIQAAVRTGWAHDLIADRSVVREHAPRISAPGDTDVALERDPVARAVRIPGVAFTAARRALSAGMPVLVQVPRRGYVPALACSKCRTPARCRHCNGPLALPDGNDPHTGSGDRRAVGARAQRRGAAAAAALHESAPRESARPDEPGPGAIRSVHPGSARELGITLSRKESGAVAHSPSCRWCGKVEAAFRCSTCGSRVLRGTVIGAARTAEELGRAFPGIPIRGSGGAEVLDEVPDGPQVVVSTIGAEPSAPGGYGVALLLDGWALLGRADLRAAEDALRRWLSAATLVRPTGQVIVMAEPSLPTVQALVRWDPIGHADLELDARTEVRFPPAVRLAAVDGTTDSVTELLSEAKLPDGVELLGPVPLPPGARKPFSSGDSPGEVERMILRVDRSAGAALSRALTAAQAVRSTHRDGAPLRVQIDPVDIG